MGTLEAVMFGCLFLLAICIGCLSVVLMRLTGNMKKIDFSKFKEDEENEYEEEIMNIAEEGQQQGLILADEAEMISNIFEFGDMDAKDVMQFRQKILGIEAGTGLRDAVTYMVNEPYSRYPIYEEDLDHIVGVIHLRDAVKAILAKPEGIVDSIMRKPVFVHEAMDINELLTKMKNDKMHMAIVLDEFGQTAGLIAMEDILETIVGDIFDEYDKEDIEFIRLPEEGHFIASGMIRLDDLEEELDITFDTEEFEILNGFLINELGHLPEQDETVEIHFKGYCFKTSEQKDKVLRQIHITKEEESVEE